MFYSIFLTIFLQVFNVRSFYHREFNSKNSFLDSSSKFFVLKIINVTTCTLLITINLLTVLPMILRSSSFCKLLNSHLKCVSRAGKVKQDKIHFTHKIFIIVPITGMFINGFASYGITYFAFYSIFSHFGIMCQFMAGHLYEWTLFERVKNHLKMLQRKLQLKNSKNVEKTIKLCMETHYNYKNIAKQLATMFELNKLVGLAAALALFSMYLFYDFEYIINGSIKKFEFRLKFPTNVVS